MVKSLGAQAVEIGTDNRDPSMVIEEHMHKFAFSREFENLARAIEPIKRMKNGDASGNKTLLLEMQQQSSAVRELYAIGNAPIAESLQRKVVEKADQLDTNVLSKSAADVRRAADFATDNGPNSTDNGSSPTGGGAKPAMLKSADALARAAASPFIERARLGAIQLRQGHESAAEKTFEEALKKGLPAEAFKLEDVRKLHSAVSERYLELQVKRKLPELFIANIDWIDTSGDGRTSVEELHNASISKVTDVTAKTLVNYLLKNFDNIDEGVKGLDACDVQKHWQKQRDALDAWR